MADEYWATHRYNLALGTSGCFPPYFANVGYGIARTEGALDVAGSQRHREPDAEAVPAARDLHLPETQDGCGGLALRPVELDEAADLTEHEGSRPRTPDERRVLPGETRS